jgi:hypothetical protein
VEKNVQGIKQQLAHFISFSGKNAAIMVNNADWLCELKLVDFLRDIGKHFSINAMLSKDAIRQRLEDRNMEFPTPNLHIASFNLTTIYIYVKVIIVVFKSVALTNGEILFQEWN